MSNNPVWDVFEQARAELISAFAASGELNYPSEGAIRIVAPGSERTRPASGGRTWANLVLPSSPEYTWETANACVWKPVVEVWIAFEEASVQPLGMEELLSLSAVASNTLSRSVLGGMARRSPLILKGSSFTQTGKNNVLWSQLKFQFEVQVEETQVSEIVTFIEQTGQEISVTVEGLDPSEFEIRKADGSVVTSSADYTGTSGTARVRVFDASDLTKLERVKLDVKGPTAASKTVPNCATLTEAAANLAITAAGLTPDSDGAFSNTVAKGIVISQSPAAGTAVYAGSTVTITVSFGVEYKVVPVTKDLLPAAAEAALVAAGLVLGTSTSEMTDDTAAGLVASSSPAAGTGVAAGTAVNLTVSLGDRHTSIPVYQCWGDGVANTLYVTPTSAFDWVHPNGTVQNGLTCTYIPTRGAGIETVFIRCKAGKTVADLTAMQYGVAARSVINTEDFKYTRMTDYLFSVSTFTGDADNLKDAVGTIVQLITLNGLILSAFIYGSINNWVPVKSGIVYLSNMMRMTGSLKFVAGAVVADLRFTGSTGFSYADIAQTIINWDAGNANTFARTGVFDKYKRSLIGAANPAAEAAIVSLIAKGCNFTFLAE